MSNLSVRYGLVRVGLNDLSMTVYRNCRVYLQSCGSGTACYEATFDANNAPTTEINNDVLGGFDYLGDITRSSFVAYIDKTNDYIDGKTFNLILVNESNKVVYAESLSSYSNDDPLPYELTLSSEGEEGNEHLSVKNGLTFNITLPENYSELFSDNQYSYDVRIYTIPKNTETEGVRNTPTAYITHDGQELIKTIALTSGLESIESTDTVTDFEPYCTYAYALVIYARNGDIVSNGILCCVVKGTTDTALPFDESITPSELWVGDTPDYVVAAQNSSGAQTIRETIEFDGIGSHTKYLYIVATTDDEGFTDKLEEDGNIISYAILGEGLPVITGSNNEDFSEYANSITGSVQMKLVPAENIELRGNVAVSDYVYGQTPTVTFSSNKNGATVTFAIVTNGVEGEFVSMENIPFDTLNVGSYEIVAKYELFEETFVTEPVGFVVSNADLPSFTLTYDNNGTLSEYDGKSKTINGSGFGGMPENSVATVREHGTTSAYSSSIDISKTAGQHVVDVRISKPNFNSVDKTYTFTIPTNDDLAVVSGYTIPSIYNDEPHTINFEIPAANINGICSDDNNSTDNVTVKGTVTYAQNGSGIQTVDVVFSLEGSDAGNYNAPQTHTGQSGEIKTRVLYSLAGNGCASVLDGSGTLTRDAEATTEITITFTNILPNSDLTLDDITFETGSSYITATGIRKSDNFETDKSYILAVTRTGTASDGVDRVGLRISRMLNGVNGLEEVDYAIHTIEQTYMPTVVWGVEPNNDVDNLSINNADHAITVSFDNPIDFVWHGSGTAYVFIVATNNPQITSIENGSGQNQIPYLEAATKGNYSGYKSSPYSAYDNDDAHTYTLNITIG